MTTPVIKPRKPLASSTPDLVAAVATAKAADDTAANTLLTANATLNDAQDAYNTAVQNKLQTGMALSAAQFALDQALAGS